MSLFNEVFLEIHGLKIILFLLWILSNMVLPPILQEIRQKNQYIKIYAIDCILDNHNGLRKPFYILKLLWFLPFIIAGFIWATIRESIKFIIYKKV